MSKSQDYISRIRCQNDLPPPLLPPKLLKYSIPEEEQIGSSSLLSSLYRKENVNNLVETDNDIGVLVDIIKIPGIFDASKEESKLYALSDHIKLHPNDRILLRDPGIDKIVKNQPNVSFLRRTEYIGSRRQTANSENAKREINKETDHSAAARLKSIEATFSKATETLNDLSKLKHPLKKNLKATKVWSVLPDTSKMDLSFSTIRLLGSASTSNRGVSPLEYRTSIFKPIELEQADWMSFFTTDEESARQVKRKIDDVNENIPDNEGSSEGQVRFKYTKRNDYDMKAAAMEDGIKEVALRFDDESSTIYYNPIQSKAELKRHRLNESLKELVEQVDYDIINLNIREATLSELNERNTIRHEHDPVNYEAIEELENENENSAVQES